MSSRTTLSSLVGPTEMLANPIRRRWLKKIFGLFAIINTRVRTEYNLVCGGKIKKLSEDKRVGVNHVVGFRMPKDLPTQGGNEAVITINEPRLLEENW